MNEQTLFSIDWIPFAVSQRPFHLFHSHPQFEICYFYNGKGQYRVRDRLVNIPPGSLLITDGATPHGPSLAPGCTRTLIHFHADLVAPFLQSAQPLQLLRPFRHFGCRLWQLSPACCLAIEQSLDKLDYWNKQTGPVSAVRFRQAFLDLLLDIYEISSNDPAFNESCSHKEQLVQLALSYIDQHFHRNIALEQIADSIPLSKFYLSKIFKQTTGMTIQTYIQHKRISQASIWLKHDVRKSVTSIGNDLGFSCLSHFSSAFKQLIGTSPEQYRKRFVSP